MTTAKKRAANIRLAVFDIDGVLTDGTLTYDDRGREYKTFHTHDGLGLKLLQQAGIAVAVISARQSTVVDIRMRELGIEHVYQGQQDKLKALQHLLQRLSLEHAQVAYTGDDLQDLPVMHAVGFAVAVANAVDTVKKSAHWISECTGGRGAVREICEYILSAQDKLPTTLPTTGATQ
jgi:3-deoxy-D-manno-octulosonate 8-phosphate phosphatase (KDO 8-P phosphatase)